MGLGFMQKSVLFNAGLGVCDAGWVGDRWVHAYKKDTDLLTYWRFEALYI